MQKIRWVIQNNLLAKNDLKQLQFIFLENDIAYYEVIYIPFSEELPYIPIDDNHYNIYYGSISFIRNIIEIYGNDGIFYDENIFSMENYLNHWGSHMLNSDMIKTTLKDFVLENHDADKLFFIRPDSDNKEFAGEVRSFKEILNWNNNLQKADNVNLNENTKIIVSTPYNIAKEWRNFVVNGQIISSSLYRKYFKLNKSSEDVPESMLDFVNQRILEYKPNEIFCMDIGFSGDQYYIIECGAFNSSGFYASDIAKIILNITKYIKHKINNE